MTVLLIVFGVACIALPFVLVPYVKKRDPRGENTGKAEYHSGVDFHEPGPEPTDAEKRKKAGLPALPSEIPPEIDPEPPEAA